MLINETVKGINVCNPVDVDKEYLLSAVKYAAENGFNHIQINGPIHNPVKGNIDGMTPYRKYSQFNGEKDPAYVEKSLDAVNVACKEASCKGIRVYMWHHELELPAGFKAAYPQVCNSYGDIEVTHPLVKDFLVHKLTDFFTCYPQMAGIVLTLHETKIPLLKLKDQKLGKVERVKYVTQILFETCRSLGKELIVRPFASIEEDYAMMTKAYEEISPDLLIMDKWTQFDWSLTLPHNAFYHKIKKNPLMVEADIFGEFFGKGRLPLMLRDHITEKFAYCNTFSPKGYVARIDRGGSTSFGDVNEVNLNIFHAALSGQDVDAAINTFFARKYPQAAEEVKALMLPTEEILKATIYTNGYYFTELSFFPTLNHSKNHYYFEMMTDACEIASNEWYIPKKWKRGPLEALLQEKQSAAEAAAVLYERLLTLETKIEAGEYRKLWVKFCNLKLVTRIWLQLSRSFMNYVKYFETREEVYAARLEQDLELLQEQNKQGTELLGNEFYCMNGRDALASGNYISNFVSEMRESFRLEREASEQMEQRAEVLDYIICGGAMEGHKLQKEVNFSDTLVRDGALCRIPGNRRGMQWSSINAHGWFSYEIKIKPNAENQISIWMESVDEELDVCITVNDQKYRISDPNGSRREHRLTYQEAEGENFARIRFDKVSGHTPCIFAIMVKDSVAAT